MNTIQLKLHANLKTYKKGDIITLRSRNGIPVEVYWRSRLQEAETNHCVEIIDTSKTNSKKTVTKKVKESKNDD